LRPSFFASSYLESLVYLDVSDMPGSLQKPVFRHTLSSVNLPNLRILKAQGREVEDKTAYHLLRAFRAQLWSVDLSRNKLTDHVFEPMHCYSFAARGLRTDRFDVEGRIIYFARPGVSPSIRFVAESDWSASFSHPRRHLADAPLYTSSAEDGPPPSFNRRMNGRVKIRPDSANALKTIFSGNAGSHSPSLGDVQGLDICQSHQGITHLYLNDNNISAAAFAQMIRSSPGQLQRLECDSMSFKLPEAAPRSWLSIARLSGTLGWAHVFRPVFSSNLQVLRIHHSLVTQLLSVELGGLSAMANLWLAETHVLPRAELAYPEAFVPDMNPRLQSLVLTRIPRYSTGPLIDKLIDFLKLASIQERAIQDIETARRHGPVTLLGLRHLRLEFEPDPREQPGDDSDDEFDLDAGAVMDETEEFSFFGESKWSSTKASSTAAAANHPPKPTPSANQSARPSPAHIPSLSPQTPTSLSQPETHPSPRAQPETPPSAQPQPQPQPEPQPQPQPEPEPEHITYTWTPRKTATPETEQIWIGTPSSSSSSNSNPQEHSHNTKPTAKEEYTRLLRTHPDLKTNPVCVTPCHIAAGAPRAAWLFSDAWEAILCPLGDCATTTNRSRTAPPTKPTRAELKKGMRDVVAAIKGYRVETRRAYEEVCGRVGEEGGEVRWGAPHFHWGGRLEVLLGEEGGGGRGLYR
jgi:hypothetical protein